MIIRDLIENSLQIEWKRGREYLPLAEFPANFEFSGNFLYNLNHYRNFQVGSGEFSGWEPAARSSPSTLHGETISWPT